MNLQALQLLKQAETFIDSQSWKVFMSSWKHTSIFIRKKNRYFCHILRLKRSKIASKCTLCLQVLDSILPTVNIESGLKGFYTVCGGQHSKWCQSERQNQHLESPKTVFFSKTRGHFTKERDRFLIFNRKTYKNDTLTTSKPSLCCEVSFKVPLPHPRNQSLTDFSWCAQNWTSFSFSEHFLHKFLSR